MNEPTGNNLSRAERLAAKLRENLRRRKAQARDQQQMPRESGPSGVSNDEPSS